MARTSARVYIAGGSCDEAIDLSTYRWAKVLLHVDDDERRTEAGFWHIGHDALSLYCTGRLADQAGCKY
jgi:hypothetical protein